MGLPLPFRRREAPDTNSTPLHSWGLPVRWGSSLGRPGPHGPMDTLPTQDSLPRAPLLPGSDLQATQVWNRWDLSLGGLQER